MRVHRILALSGLCRCVSMGVCGSVRDIRGVHFNVCVVCVCRGVTSEYSTCPASFSRAKPSSRAFLQRHSRTPGIVSRAYIAHRYFGYGYVPLAELAGIFGMEFFSHRTHRSFGYGISFLHNPHKVRVPV